MDLEGQVVHFFENLANSIPFPFYVYEDREGLQSVNKSDGNGTESKFTPTKKGKEKKKHLQKCRYDSSNWKCTSQVLSQRASKSLEPHNLLNKTKQKQGISSGKGHGSMTQTDISREELRKRFYEKISALQQQQQQKPKKKYTKEEIKAHRTLRRKQLAANAALKKENVSSSASTPIQSDLALDLTLNNVTQTLKPSKEKLKQISARESGEKPSKRRCMIEALREAEKQKTERSDWKKDERDKVEKKEAYDKAILRAQGEKVYDNVTKLKKALKVKKKNK